MVDSEENKAKIYQTLDANYQDQQGPCKSIEGYILIITGLHPQAQQDDILDAFTKFGQIKNFHLNLDRYTGFVKGYALIQYENIQQAKAAIQQMDESQIYDKKIRVNWAFKRPPQKKQRKKK